MALLIWEWTSREWNVIITLTVVQRERIRRRAFWTIEEDPKQDQRPTRSFYLTRPRFPQSSDSPLATVSILLIDWCLHETLIDESTARYNQMNPACFHGNYCIIEIGYIRVTVLLTIKYWCRRVYKLQIFQSSSLNRGFLSMALDFDKTLLIILCCLLWCTVDFTNALLLLKRLNGKTGVENGW